MYIINLMNTLKKFIKTKQRYIDALCDMFVFFAIVHIFLTFILALKHWDFSYVSVFYIESVSEFIPGIEKGLQNQIISVLIIAGVYFFFYSKRKK